jgi:hypothetical protein
VDHFDFLLESGKPLIMGDHAPPPCLDALLGIQLRRVSRLRLEDETVGCFTDNLCDAGPLMLRSSIMDHQQPLAGIIGHQLPQELRQRLLRQGGTDMAVVAPGQRRLINEEQLPRLRLLFQQGLQLSPKDRLFPGLGFQVAMPQPTESKPQGMQQPVHTLPTILETKPRVDNLLHQFGGPHTGMIARLPRATADSLFDLRPLIRRESRWPPWDRCSFQPWQASFVDRVHPATNRLLIAVQPLGNLRAALPIKPQQQGGVALPQLYIMSPAKSAPHLLPGHRRIRDFQHAQALPLRILAHVYQQGLRNRNYFVGLL